MSDPSTSLRAGGRRALLKALLEIVLVGAGVFLGMAVDQWRTERQQRAQALEGLRRFKIEIENNRAAVANVADYHVRLRAEIEKYLDPKTRPNSNIQMRGIQPVRFEQTAWELALATRALADIDPAIAFELTRVYGLQQSYTGLSTGMLQAMYLRPPDGDWPAFLQSLKVYYDDVIALEPMLLERYGVVAPMIDRALKD